MSGLRHAPAALYPWAKDFLYPADRRLGGPQSFSGHTGARESPLTLPGIELGRPAVQSVVRRYTDRAFSSYSYYVNIW
jgi:hypothetical protein